jgi:hypothetical protein
MSEEINTNTQNEEFQEEDRNSFIGFNFGLIATVAWTIPILGIIISSLAITFSVKDLKASKKTLAYIGISLGVIFLVLSVVNWFSGTVKVINV